MSGVRVMKSAIFYTTNKVTRWFDNYLDTINYALRINILKEIKEDSFVLKEGYSIKYQP